MADKKPRTAASFLLQSAASLSTEGVNTPTRPAHRIPPGALLESMAVDKDSLVAELRQRVTDAESQSTSSQAEISELRQALEIVKNAGELRRIPPVRCRAMKYNGRLETSYSDERFRGLRRSLREDGQIQPILIRPIEGDPDFDFEVVAGHRRLEACRLEGINVLAEVRKLSLWEAIKLMEAENNEREDKSPYEQAASWKLMLDDSVYANQSDLAKQLGYDRTLVVKYLSLTDLPSPIVQLMTDIRDLKLRNGANLAAWIRKHPDAIRMAEELVSTGVKLDPNTIMAKLTAQPDDVAATKTIVGNTNKKIATLGFQKGVLSTVHLHSMTDNQRDQVLKLIESFGAANV